LGGAVVQIAKGLHRIGSDIVNSYLVVGTDGVTIIDAGLPRYWKHLNSELAQLGKTVDDVRALILTHGDTDHIGFAAQLSREKNIPAFLHPADDARAHLEVKKPNSGWGPVKIGPLAGFMWYSATQGGLKIPPAGKLLPVEDGQVLDVPGSPRIIHVPGHTPAPFTLEPEQAMTSLARLGELDATWVLPGHGPAWNGGATEAVRLTLEAAAR
jgi:glyoxylase-like metal-dependent hydrolase (beta-lactamase superfamily II)